MPLKQLLKKFFLNFLKIFLFLFFVFFFFILIKSSYNLFFLKEIKIVNEERNYVLGINEIKKMPLFFLDEDNIKNILLKKNPRIKDLKIEKKYPNILIIQIIKDNPIAILVVNNGYFYLNSQGKIVYKSNKINEEKIPLINFYQKLDFQNYYPGKKIEFKEIVLALELLKNMNDLNIKVNSLDITSLDVILFNLENKRVFFNTGKDINTQWYQFEKIFRQFKIEGKDYKEIDLRFDKPIVRF